MRTIWPGYPHLMNIVTIQVNLTVGSVRDVPIQHCNNHQRMFSEKKHTLEIISPRAGPQAGLVHYSGKRRHKRIIVFLRSWAPPLPIRPMSTRLTTSSCVRGPFRAHRQSLSQSVTAMYVILAARQFKLFGCTLSGPKHRWKFEIHTNVLGLRTLAKSDIRVRRHIAYCSPLVPRMRGRMVSKRTSW